MTALHFLKQIEFPTLGRLVTNRAGRVEFAFNPLFMEYFEREHYALVREVRREGGLRPGQGGEEGGRATPWSGR